MQYHFRSHCTILVIIQPFEPLGLTQLQMFDLLKPALVLTLYREVCIDYKANCFFELLKMGKIKQKCRIETKIIPLVKISTQI